MDHGRHLCEGKKSGSLSTALSEFRRVLPIVHLVSENDSELRQAIIFGSTARAGGTWLRRGNWLCLESSARRVYAFRSRGPAVLLPDSAFASLVSICEARCQGYGPMTFTDEVEYSMRDWRVSDDRHEMRALLPECVLSHEANVPTLSGEDTDLDRDGEAPRAALVEAFLDGYPQFAVDDGAVQAALDAVVQEWLDRFLSRLQSPALDACQTLGRRSLSAFNSISAERLAIVSYRAQATRAIPLLGFLLAEIREPSLLPIRLAIDSCAPLVDAAANAFRVPKEVVRFFSAKSLQDIGVVSAEIEALWRSHPDFVLRSVAVVAPEQRPRTSSEWAAFYRLVEALTEHKDNFLSLVSPFLREASRRGFQATVSAIERVQGSVATISDVQPYLDCLAAALRRKGVPAALSIPDFSWRYAAERGLLRVIDEARRWRHALARHASLFINGADSKSPPKLTLPFALPQQLARHRFVFLDSWAALVAEGVRMSNCVGALYADCMRGERLVFSLQTRERNPVATLDISLRHSDGETEAVLNDVRGPHNLDPTPQAAAVAQRFTKRVEAAAQREPEKLQHWLLGMERRRAGNFERHRLRVLRKAERQAIDAFVPKAVKVAQRMSNAPAPCPFTVRIETTGNASDPRAASLPGMPGIRYVFASTSARRTRMPDIAFVIGGEHSIEHIATAVQSYRDMQVRALGIAITAQHLERPRMLRLSPVHWQSQLGDFVLTVLAAFLPNLIGTDYGDIARVLDYNGPFAFATSSGSNPKAVTGAAIEDLQAQTLGRLLVCGLSAVFAEPGSMRLVHARAAGFAIRTASTETASVSYTAPLVQRHGKLLTISLLGSY